MALEETNILNRVLKTASQAGARLFRNQVGSYRLKDGRYITSGLCAGSSDLIGWLPVVVTPEMVGKTVAIFTAIEVKTAKGRVQDNQINFIARVQDAGGIAGVARCMKDALDLIGDYCKMQSSNQNAQGDL